MDRALFSRPLGQRLVSPYLLARLGDVALATVWTVLAVSSISRMLSDTAEVTWLVTAHQAVSAIVLCISAALFVFRRPAKFRDASWQSRLVALIGTWMTPVVILQPLTWTADWVLTVATAGLLVTHLVVFWSILTLGRNLSIFPEARMLVRKGPYAIVRHPLYATYTAMNVFFLLPRFGLIALALTLLGTGCELWRARNEEQVLRATFPEYEDYARETPRFIPRLSFLNPS